MTIHPKKSKVMLLKRGTLTGPLLQLWLGGKPIKLVKTTTIFGMILDNNVKWKDNAEELTLNYARKLNLLKSMRFLPRDMLKDFYWKVIFPSITYCIEQWGSCSIIQFNILERMQGSVWIKVGYTE